MTKTSFGDQLQQIWRTRPARLPRQGPIAGVAAGFAQRYNVDPVLVRVAFVVSAIFGGSGVVLYLLAWLLLSGATSLSSCASACPDMVDCAGRGSSFVGRVLVGCGYDCLAWRGFRGVSGAVRVWWVL